MSLLALLTAAAVQSATPASASRSAVPAVCNDPVYMLVMVDRLDRTKSKAYGDGLRSTGIVKRHGGQYKAVGAPLVMLEGAWPKDRSMVLETYPCLEALRTMWYSEEYQKRLKPLRAGSGEYTVAVFKSYTTGVVAK